jgi:hypothetical protein
MVKPLELVEDPIAEYRSELLSLTDEWLLTEDTLKICEKRKGVIRDRVIDIATVTGGANQRVLIPVVEVAQEWDRQVVRKGGGVDLAKLEEVLGADRFRLLCDETVVYEVNPAKLNEARLSGWLTDAIISASTVQPSVGYRLTLRKLKAGGE